MRKCQFWVNYSFNSDFCLIAQILNTESELKKLAAENPDLKDAYISKQRRLKVSKHSCSVQFQIFPFWASALCSTVPKTSDDLSDFIPLSMCT